MRLPSSLSHFHRRAIESEFTCAYFFFDKVLSFCPVYRSPFIGFVHRINMFVTIHIGASVRQKHSRRRRSLSTICGWHTFSVAIDIYIYLFEWPIPCTHFGIEHIPRWGSFFTTASKSSKNSSSSSSSSSASSSSLSCWVVRYVCDSQFPKCEMLYIDVNRMCAARLRFSSLRE